MSAEIQVSIDWLAGDGHRLTKATRLISGEEIAAARDGYPDPVERTLLRAVDEVLEDYRRAPAQPGAETQ